VVDAGLDRIPTFGALRDLARETIGDLLGALQSAQLIVAVGDEYPTLALTPAGREVMHDRVRARIRWPEARPGRRGRARAPMPVADAAGPVDARLVERLRALRRDLAARADLPAFCVFHDRTLEEIARARPADEQALARVPGIGPHKIARYGAAVLELLRAAPQAS
jgi:ATP-dependent DNA helicase RecQ